MYSHMCMYIKTLISVYAYVCAYKQKWVTQSQQCHSQAKIQQFLMFPWEMPEWVEDISYKVLRSLKLKEKMSHFFTSVTVFSHAVGTTRHPVHVANPKGHWSHYSYWRWSVIEGGSDQPRKKLRISHQCFIYFKIILHSVA